MEFSYFLHNYLWYNVKFFMVLRFVTRTLNFRSVLDKIYLRLHENLLEGSLKH